MRIGPYSFETPVVLAPMAGVTDLPFRRVCREAGAALTVGEMVASRAELRETELSLRRYQVDPEEAVPVVQLLGAEPQEMAEAAVVAESMGAKVVDINFGCPSRMVCGKACGSALMADLPRALKILETVVRAVRIPVTVKMRTGWDAAHRNAVELAQGAQAAGCAAVTVHGRTRAARFSGPVDRAGIAEVVRAVAIPVIANGDIRNAAEAASMRRETGAAGVMIGRGAEGRPWIFAQTAAALAGSPVSETPDALGRLSWVLRHLDLHMQYWGTGLDSVRKFRKHVLWYLQDFDLGRERAQTILEIESAEMLRTALIRFFETCHDR